jgi:hypothetical protein
MDDGLDTRWGGEASDNFQKLRMPKLCNGTNVFNGVSERQLPIRTMFIHILAQ